ncbi:Na(+)/H(+) exchange regulatory cofactor NHE-RF1 isoform X2 [Esox lucius]|uniref:Na(+)/H(+) exchange regulatory cofactor NHE-RF1 isoform X2 n=1 Tax=Esox lucius TaxID=8010 RepID=UPI000575E426|nr:Na(+)/H(+) exchange regulatory cofactor NHE-RF1 isoform X2 [Esox lucius]
MPSKREDHRPRLCVLEKGANGYGFHLHGEKGKTGQFIRLVEPDSPSEISGLRAGDRLVFVNGENVENESHQQVVSRIRATTGQLELIVVDQETEQLLKKHNMKCLKEYVSEGIPLPSNNESESVDVEENRTPCESPREGTPVPQNNGENHTHGEIHTQVEKKPSINSEKINGMSVEGKSHSEVVAAIKACGEETSLLVVDPDTDAFFKRCRVAPTPEHITGSLPEPVVNGDMDKVNHGNGKLAKEVEQDCKPSISPSPSNASSNASLTTPSTITPPPEGNEPVIIEAIPALNLSLQQVKERAHQKRSNKRAPPMDWSKKNELFSNL